MQGLIFVVDSNDKDRIAEARDELHKLLQNSELSKAKVLVFANKQDLSNVLSPTEVTEKLYLGRLAQKVWYVQACSATTGEGLHEGLDWLAAALKEKNGAKWIHLIDPTESDCLNLSWRLLIGNAPTGYWEDHKIIWLQAGFSTLLRTSEGSWYTYSRSSLNNNTSALTYIPGVKPLPQVWGRAS